MMFSIILPKIRAIAPEELDNTNSAGIKNISMSSIIKCEDSDIIPLIFKDEWVSTERSNIHGERK